MICTDLPGKRFEDPYDHEPKIREPVWLGIQYGKEVIHQTPADRSKVTLHLEFGIGNKADGAPNFVGPYAQGHPEDRFFYLSWGVKHESGEFEMFRRLKIRLGHLSWTQINHSIKENEPIVVELKLTDDKGGPLCATPSDKHITWEIRYEKHTV